MTLAKCTIVALDPPNVQVTAQYNPKELGIDKSVPWTKHKPPQGDAQILEFTSAENRSLSMELFFDTFETGDNVHTKYVSLLEQMTMVPPGKTGKEAHPPKVMVTWGAGIPKFKGVIEKLSTKFTMFLQNGTPVRASCSISVKEVDEVQGGTGGTKS